MKTKTNKLTTTLNDSREEYDRRNYFMINIHESMGQVGIELATPGSTGRLASVAGHVTDCATRLVKKSKASAYTTSIKENTR